MTDIVIFGKKNNKICPDFTRKLKDLFGKKLSKKNILTWKNYFGFNEIFIRRPCENLLINQLKPCNALESK